MKILIKASDNKYNAGPYKYITTHGIGPGTLPKDVELVKVVDLPNFRCELYLDRPLTSEELDYYDIRSETGERGGVQASIGLNTALNAAIRAITCDDDDYRYKIMNKLARGTYKIPEDISRRIHDIVDSCDSMPDESNNYHGDCVDKLKNMMENSVEASQQYIKSDETSDIVGDRYTGSGLYSDRTWKILPVDLFKRLAEALADPQIVETKPKHPNRSDLYKNRFEAFSKIINLPEEFTSEITQTWDSGSPSVKISIKYEDQSAGYTYEGISREGEAGIKDAISVIYERMLRYSEPGLLDEDSVERWIIVDKDGKQTSDKEFISEESANQWKEDAIRTCLPNFKLSYLSEYYNRVVKTSDSTVKSSVDIDDSMHVGVTL